ncbi:LYR motif-containing protein 2, partial [Tyrophagus putrescentiae]
MRKFFRVTKNLADDSQKQELRDWVKSEFKTKSKITDKELIEMHLNNGQNSLRDLENSLRHAHAFK